MDNTILFSIKGNGQYNLVFNIKSQRYLHCCYSGKRLKKDTVVNQFEGHVFIKKTRTLFLLFF